MSNVYSLIRYLYRKFVFGLISKSKKVIPYVMIFAFIITTPDFSFLRKFIRNQTETIFNLDENTDLTEMENAYEVIALRTENSKTFKKDNDSFEIVLYSDDVHYLTEEGVYHEIDNTIRKLGCKYKNRSNRYSVEFSDYINSDKSKIIYKGNHLEWKFNFTEKSKGLNKDNILKFENVSEDVDLEYVVLNDRIKENIILKKYIEDFSFSYTIFTELKLEREENSINLYNNHNELIFKINDYFMYDSHMNFSYDIETSIKELEQNEYLITVAPSHKYLKEATYPVTIDPEIIINQGSNNGNIEYKLFDKDGIHYNDPDILELLLGTTKVCTICGGDGVYTGYENCNICNGRGFTVGPDRELIICPHCKGGKVPVNKICENCSGIQDPTTLFYKLNFMASSALSNLKNSNFLYAYTNFTTSSSSCTSGVGTVNMKKLSKADWERFNLTGYTSSADVISSVKFNNSSSFTHKFDLYDYFYENIEKFGTDFSLYFELELHSGNNSYVKYNNPKDSNVEVVIGYSNEAGLRDYYTYEEIQSTNSSTSYIAHNSGNLTTVFSDFSDEKLINLAHIYNSNRSHMLGNYGYGFSLNYEESISMISSNIIRLTKGDKSTVDFILDGDEYIAKDGSGDRIFFSEDFYYLKTISKVEKVYSRYNDSHRLFTIYPNFENPINYIEIEYDSDIISFVKSFQKENNHSLPVIITQVEFCYSYDMCDEIKIMKINEFGILELREVIKYSYDNKRLENITKKISGNSDYYEKCDFIYGKDTTGKNTITIKDNITNGVKFTFDAGNRVEKANVLVTNVSEENLPFIQFSFDNQGRRLVISDYQNYKVTYTFDSYFRTKSVTDTFGYTSFTEYMDIFYSEGEYNSNPNYDLNHKIINSSAPFKNTVNLVNNHSFELGDTPLYWTGSNQKIVKTSLYGERAICITSSSTDGAYSYQQIDVKKGIKYTVTGYVKNTSDSGDGAFIDVTGSYITINSCSDPIKKINNFVFYSLTFTANQNTTATLRLWNKSEGDAFFDLIQVNDSTINTRYNYLQNASFEHSSGWTGLNNNYFENEPNGKFDISTMGNRCAKIRSRSFYQNIPVLGKAGDIFIFGGSAYLDNVNANGTIRLKIYNTDDSVDTFEFSFDKNDTNIQYLMKRVEAKEDYNQLALEIQNSSSYDYLYVDNLALYREGYGVEIKYCPDGKISLIDNEITGSTTNYHYDEDGNIFKITEKNVNLDFSYDENSKLLDKVLYKNVEQRYSRDANGNIVEFSLVSKEGNLYNNTTSTIYSPDKLYPTHITDEYDRLTVNIYDYLTGLIKTTTQNGVKTSYSYNEFGDIKGIRTDSKNIEYIYEGRKLRNIIIDNCMLEDDIPMVYEFQYNDYNNIEYILVADVTVFENVYKDYNGIYTGLIDSSKYGAYTIRYTYDEENRVKETYINDTIITEYSYDNIGNVSEVVDFKTGIIYNYNYDYKNRLTSIQSSDGNNLSYQYDEDDYLKYITNINGTIEYEYTGDYNNDDLDREILKKEKFGDFFTEYVYQTEHFNKLEKVYIGNTNARICSLFTYDTFNKNVDNEIKNFETNRIKEINFKYDEEDETSLIKLTYSYDSFGNIEAIEKFQNNFSICKETFSYDIYNQLIEYSFEDKADNLKTVYLYLYDIRGNIVLITKKVGTHLTSIISLEYKQSGWLDQLTSVTIDGVTYTIGEYDEIGNPNTYLGYEISYYLRSIARLKKGNNVYQYGYNAEGIRISKDINGIKTNYVLDGNRIIRETRNGVEISYFYDVNGDIIAFSYENNYYYYIKNLQNDIIAIASSSGSIIGEYQYDAYGNIIHQDQSEILDINPFRFKSYYFDTETSFYYCNSRYYDPLIGRWINADDISMLAEGEINLFRYCNNNPLMFLDQSGFSDRLCFQNDHNSGLDLFFVAISIAVMITVPSIRDIIKELSKTTNFYFNNQKSKSETISQADAKIRRIIRKNSKNRYWSATLKSGYVDIGRPLSFDEAVVEVMKGNNIFTVTSSEAEIVALAAGGKVQSIISKEIDKGKQNVIGYYYHYHVNRKNSAHIWYLF